MAFVVGKAVGLDTGLASADYIQLYHGNAELLAESLEIVQRTASVILAAIEPESVSQETTQEPPPQSKRARRSRAVTATTEAA